MTELNQQTEDKAVLMEKINQETAQIAWDELQVYFAAGRTFLVSNDLDLVEVAYSMQIDDYAVVQEWMKQGLLTKVTNDKASTWFDNKANLWAVVVKPWVLLQESQIASDIA